MGLLEKLLLVLFVSVIVYAALDLDSDGSDWPDNFGY